LHLLEGADWRSNLNTDDNVINIAVLVFLHTRGTSADPSSQRAELNRVRFMPTHESMLRKLFFHVFADNASLYTSHHVAFIHPFDLIHSSHVH